MISLIYDNEIGFLEAMGWNLVVHSGFDFLQLALDFSNDSYDFSKISKTVHAVILKSVKARREYFLW